MRMKLDYIEPERKRKEKHYIIEHRDAKYKQKMRQKREGRKTRENNLLLGDYVLVKQPRKNECSVNYIYGQILLHLCFVDLTHLWLKVITFMGDTGDSVQCTTCPTRYNSKSREATGTTHCRDDTGTRN